MEHSEQLPLVNNVEQTSQSSPSLLPTYVSPVQPEKQAPVPSAVVAAPTAAADSPASSAPTPRQSLPVRLYSAFCVFLIGGTILGTSFGVLAGLHCAHVVLIGLFVLFPASRFLAPFVPTLAALFPATSSDAGIPPAGFWTLVWEFGRAAFVGGFAGGAVCGVIAVFATFAALIVKTRGIPTNWTDATATSPFACSKRGQRTKRSAARRVLASVMKCILPGLALSTGSDLVSVAHRYLYNGEVVVDEVRREPLRAAAVVLVGAVVFTVAMWMLRRTNQAKKEGKVAEQAVSLEESLHGVDAGDASTKV
ncbi:hypothetical protein BDW22DRAFT_1421534 [Trametopsis cervina]|nr:hypothetical protein BDW22DRAFT_1421534 [Trametopsis cervina]